MNTRAYSLIQWKSADDEKRILEGIATTPSTDRMNDIVETDGIDFKLPLPLLYQHNSRQPIGKVLSAKVSKSGIAIKAQVARSGVAGFIDEAWALLKEGLIGGLSIGFKTIEEAFNKETGGFRILKSEWLELSVVTIPANAEATILSVKSADFTVRAALGTRTGVVHLDSTRNLPGVSGPTGKVKMKPIAEQIKDFEAQVVANEARLNAIVEKSVEEGRTFSDAEKEEQTTLDADIKSVTEHIATLKKHEQRLLSKATPITPAAGADPNAASRAREGHVVSVKSNLPKGTLFTRYAMALANAGIGGSAGKREAAELAKMHWPDTPEVELVLRAAVAAGSTTGTTWAAPLLPAAQQMQEEFLELLRPATIVGRIPGLRRVPFNISIPAQTGGGTYGWVGEGAAKPVSALAFSAVTLLFNKIAGIVVLTKELVKFSNPAAEQIVRNDMVAGIAGFIDLQFVDPTVAVNGNVSPASITNGVTPTAASGTTAAAFRTDMKALMGTFITVNDDPMNTVVLMSATVALNLSLLFNTLGQREFPDLSLNGGSILGLPVVISQSVGARVIVLRANEIMLADDGPVEIDISEQASLVMDDAPQASPQTTSLVSLWQRNYVGIRADKFITWKKARSTSVSYISNAAYGG